MTEQQRKILHDKLINKVHSHWIRAWINRPFEEEEYTLEQYEKICELREKNEKIRENKKNPTENYYHELVVNDIVKFRWESKKGHKVDLTGRLLKIEKREMRKYPYFQMYYEILHCGEIFCDVEYCSKVRHRATNKTQYKHIKIPEIVKETSTKKLLGIYRSSNCYGYSYYDEDKMDVKDAAYIGGTEVPLESIKAELSLHRKHVKRKKEKHLKDKI